MQDRNDFPANDKEKELLAEGFSADLYVPALSAACLEKFPDAKVSNPVQMLELAKAEIDKLVELFPLKSKLSPREHVPFTILSRIMLESERGKKLRSQWDNR